MMLIILSKVVLLRLHDYSKCKNIVDVRGFSDVYFVAFFNRRLEIPEDSFKI